MTFGVELEPFGVAGLEAGAFSVAFGHVTAYRACMICWLVSSRKFSGPVINHTRWPLDAVLVS